MEISKASWPTGTRITSRYARARPRPRSRFAGDASAYERLLREDDGEETPEVELPRKRAICRKPEKLTVDERIQRMKAGLEPLEIPKGANAIQASEIYQMILREPPSRPPIRPGRSRKSLFPNEIFDLALYSALAGKFGKGPPPTRIVGVIRRLIMKAVAGDVSSAILILDLHGYAEKQGDL